MEIQSNYELMNKINIIANSDIPVDKSSPLFKIFNQRKEAAIRYRYYVVDEDSLKLLLELIDYCNDKIKQYLAL